MHAIQGSRDRQDASISYQQFHSDGSHYLRALQGAQIVELFFKWIKQYLRI